MKKVKLKTDIGGKLRQVCDALSEKQRKGVLVGMLVVSTILCGITVTRAFGRFFFRGTQRSCRSAGMLRQIRFTGRIKTV